jgi:hypothetical protein
LCSLFTAVGEKLVQSPQSPQRLLMVIHILIACAEYRELVELTFPFWQQLTKSIKSEQDHYRVYIEQFLLKLTKHCVHENVANLAMETDCSGSELLVRVSSF